MEAVRAKPLGMAGATLVMLVTLPAPAAPQSWSQLVPTGGPPAPRYSPAAAYDDFNDRLILFSGEDDVTPAPPRLQDVWVLTNATGLLGAPTWMQLAPTGAPPVGRFGGTAVYDPAANRLIVHGGCNSNCGFARNDVWVLTNANGSGGSPTWLPIASAPVGRAEHSAAYDPVGNRMMVFGGHTAFPATERNDVWVLSDANGLGSPTWTQLLPTGVPPSTRRDAAAAYDPVSNRLIIHGGAFCAPGCVFFSDSWVLTHANGVGGTPQWIQLAPAGTPPTRGAHTAVYDAVSNRMMVFGGTDGSSNHDSVEVLTNANGLGGSPQWVSLAPAGGPPAARQFHAAGYSPAGNRMAVTLGRAGSPLPVDLWVLADANGLTVTEISIDIKPGSGPNGINPRSAGILPVAILTTSTATGDPVDFDALEADPATVAFGPGAAGVAHRSGHAEDADGDGDLDLVVHFRIRQTGIACGDTEATLTGQTFGGQAFAGSDAVVPAGCGAVAAGSRYRRFPGGGPTDRFSEDLRRRPARGRAEKGVREAAPVGPTRRARAMPEG